MRLREKSVIGRAMRREKEIKKKESEKGLWDRD